MSGELRAQEQRPCEHAPLDCDDLGLPWRCVGCARNGTRWVTVGTVEVTTMHPTDLGWRGDADDRIAVFYPEEAA